MLFIMYFSQYNLFFPYILFGPNLDFSSEAYIYEYAEMMRLLVNRPEDFKKIMRWE